MQASATTILIFSGLLSAASMASPNWLRGQAPPGPMHPTKVPEVQEPVQARERTREQGPRKADIFGSWRLNRGDSDNGQRRSRQGRGGYGGHPNGPYGGGPGGYPGGGWGRRGGGMGNGRETEAERERSRELMNPANSLTLVKKENEVDLTDNQGRQRIFFTDGRKVKKSKDENYREIKAHWEAGRLVSEEKGPWGGKLARTFELAPNGRQLVETVHMNNRAGSPMYLHYTYDVAPESRQ